MILNLDKASTCRNVLPFTYSILKSNAINIKLHQRFLEDVTLGSCFVGLNMNFKGIWSDIRRNLFFNQKLTTFNHLPYCDQRFFFQYLSRTIRLFDYFLERYIIGWPSWDNIPEIECTFSSFVTTISFLVSNIFFLRASFPEHFFLNFQMPVGLMSK